MALANIFGWNRQDKAQTSAACGTACGQLISPQKSQQPAERHVEQGISPQKSPQPAERHVERLISLRRNPQPVVQHVAIPISK